MKKHVFTYLTLLSFLLLGGTASAQSLVYNPRGSAAAELSQKIGITDVTVNYSRPQVINNGKDRSGEIYGTNVAHYGYRDALPTFGSGNKYPWRAGANENTTLTVSTDVKIEGQALKAGSYGLFLELSEDGKETLILSSNHDSWGSYFYKPEEVVLKASIQSQETPFTNILTYDFDEISRNHGVLTLKWEKKAFPIRIDVATNELAFAQYRQKLPEAKDPQAYLEAARFCVQNQTNYEEGLTWIDKAIGSGKNFSNMSTKAGLYYRKDGYDKAIPYLDEAVQLGSPQEISAVAAQMIQLGHHEKAVEYYQLNAKNNPEDATVFLGLGNAYAAMDNKKKAVSSFKKALSLNPQPQVKANAEAQLKKLGVK